MVCNTYDTETAATCFNQLSQTTQSWAEFWVAVTLIALVGVFLIELLVFFTMYR